MERIESIEDLAPSIEATATEAEGVWTVVVRRFADDGWAGWQVTASDPHKPSAVAAATRDVLQRIKAEAERRAR